MAFLVREKFFAVEEEGSSHVVRGKQLDYGVGDVLDLLHLDGFNLVLTTSRRTANDTMVVIFEQGTLNLQLF